jgi:4-hydroxy-2-oxoheptanedioate aldolase
MELTFMHSGIMVPMVNKATEAAEVVSASRFPPVGIRGQGSPFSAMALGMTTPEYLKRANDGIVVIIQIESAEGLENVEEICNVKGVG